MNDIETHLKNPKEMKYLDNSHTQSKKKSQNVNNES